MHLVQPARHPAQAHALVARWCAARGGSRCAAGSRARRMPWSWPCTAPGSSPAPRGWRSSPWPARESCPAIGCETTCSWASRAHLVGGGGEADVAQHGPPRVRPEHHEQQHQRHLEKPVPPHHERDRGRRPSRGAGGSPGTRRSVDVLLHLPGWLERTSATMENLVVLARLHHHHHVGPEAHSAP